MFKDFIYYLEKLYVIIAIYIQIVKRQRQIVLKDYIYNMAKRCGKSFFILYIYDMAKDIGKSSEIQTYNYRQLQM